MARTGADRERGSVERLAQPSLWDRLKNDLPGLGLEARTLERELTKQLGEQKLAKLLKGTASISEEASLSADQRMKVRALDDANRKARYLKQSGTVVSPKDIVDAVRRDIEVLLNTTQYESTLFLSERETRHQASIPVNLSDFPEVQTSVVNYGTIPLIGAQRNSFDNNKLAKDLRDALLRFEPRLNPNKLRIEVRRKARAGSGETGHEVEITGEVILTPAPEHLSMVAEIDVNSAKATARLDDR